MWFVVVVSVISSQLAQKYNMVIISPILERDEDHCDVLFNTAGRTNDAYFSHDLWGQSYFLEYEIGGV